MKFCHCQQEPQNKAQQGTDCSRVNNMTAQHLLITGQNDGSMLSAYLHYEATDDVDPPCCNSFNVCHVRGELHTGISCRKSARPLLTRRPAGRLCQPGVYHWLLCSPPSQDVGIAIIPVRIPALCLPGTVYGPQISAKHDEPVRYRSAARSTACRTVTPARPPSRPPCAMVLPLHSRVLLRCASHACACRLQSRRASPQRGAQHCQAAVLGGPASGGDQRREGRKRGLGAAVAVGEGRLEALQHLISRQRQGAQGPAASRSRSVHTAEECCVDPTYTYRLAPPRDRACGLDACYISCGMGNLPSTESALASSITQYRMRHKKG